MAQWIHFPELSVNLDNVDYVMPGPDGIFKLYFASFDKENEQTAIQIDGEKAKAICEAIGRPFPFRYHTK